MTRNSIVRRIGLHLGLGGSASPRLSGSRIEPFLESPGPDGAEVAERKATVEGAAGELVSEFEASMSAALASAGVEPNARPEDKT